MTRMMKPAMLVLALAGMAMADAPRAVGPDYKPLDVAKVLAKQTFKGIAVYCVLPQSGGG